MTGEATTLAAASAKLRHVVPPAASVLLAYSGGLDSVVCIELLRRVYGCGELRLVTFDIGQGERELDRARAFAAALDAPEPEIVDLRNEFYEVHLARALQANASLRGYPIAAPIAKQLFARELGRLAVERGIPASAEGSSGRGNDQFRFSTPLALFAGNIRLIAPIRELDLTRSEEEALARTWRAPFAEDLPLGGDDVTQWCRSIASGGFTPESVIDDSVFHWYRPSGADGHDTTPVELTVGFANGLPVSLDGAPRSLLEIVRALNPLAGARGIGLVDIIEDGILGLKSREIYEAPGATVLIAAHRDLEHLCLTREELEFKASVDCTWCERVYSGHMFSPLVEALDAFVGQTQKQVEGEVRLRLSGGAARTIFRRSARSLYAPKWRHLDAGGMDPALIDGIIAGHGLPYRVLRDRAAGTGS